MKAIYLGSLLTVLATGQVFSTDVPMTDAKKVTLPSFSELCKNAGVTETCAQGLSPFPTALPSSFITPHNQILFASEAKTLSTLSKKLTIEQFIGNLTTPRLFSAASRPPLRKCKNSHLTRFVGGRDAGLGVDWTSILAQLSSWSHLYSVQNHPTNITTQPVPQFMPQELRAPSTLNVENIEITSTPRRLSPLGRSTTVVRGPRGAIKKLIQRPHGIVCVRRLPASQLRQSSSDQLPNAE